MLLGGDERGLGGLLGSGHIARAHVQVEHLVDRAAHQPAIQRDRLRNLRRTGTDLLQQVQAVGRVLELRKFQQHAIVLAQPEVPVREILDRARIPQHLMERIEPDRASLGRLRLFHECPRPHQRTLAGPACLGCIAKMSRQRHQLDDPLDPAMHARIVRQQLAKCQHRRREQVLAVPPDTQLSQQFLGSGAIPAVCKTLSDRQLCLRWTRRKVEPARDEATQAIHDQGALLLVGQAEIQRPDCQEESHALCAQGRILRAELERPLGCALVRQHARHRRGLLGVEFGGQCLPRIGEFGRRRMTNPCEQALEALARIEAIEARRYAVAVESCESRDAGAVGRQGGIVPVQACEAPSDENEGLAPVAFTCTRQQGARAGEHEQGARVFE